MSAGTEPLQVTQLLIEKQNGEEQSEAERENADRNTVSSEDEIDEDWLNRFEEEGKLKSTDEMRLLFARVLAQKISEPTSCSEKTLRIVSTLDSDVAKLFQRFCSHTTVMLNTEFILDARVVVHSGRASTNGLTPLGLSYRQLRVLEEYGLVNSDFDGRNSYQPAVLNNETRSLGAVLRHQGVVFGLEPVREKPGDLTVIGPSLTLGGIELLAAVELLPCEEYTVKLKEFFDGKGYKLNQVNISQQLGCRRLPV